jgi:hypothetical protein
MTEHRHHHGEAEEERQGADHQQPGDDQSPNRHGQGIRGNGSH